MLAGGTPDITPGAAWISTPRVMEWSCRAPALPVREAGRGRQSQGAHHVLNSAIAVIGIDIGKNSFQLVGQDKRGVIVRRQNGAAR
jgi:hypothetical protein